MYESYYINMNSQGDFGDHAVHKDGWGHMPADRLYLWAFIFYHPAVEQARYPSYHTVNGCRRYCKACHIEQVV